MVLNVDQVSSSVDTLLELAVKNRANNNNLLPQVKHVFLGLSLNTIPSDFPSRPYFLDLPFPIHPANTEVCLFVADHDKSLVEPLMQNGKLPQLKEVISISELKTLYTSPESRRMLCAKYGLFATQDNILSMLPPLLGKSFFESKKLPIKIRINENLVQNFANVFKKAVINLPTGNNISIKVGNADMLGYAIVANVLAAVKHAVLRIPGGIKSIASVSIKLSDSVALPVSLSVLDDKMVQNFGSVGMLVKEAALAEQIAAYEPSKPLTVDINGKNKLKNTRMLVHSLVKLFGPITIITLPSPDYPSRQFSSTEFLASTAKELLHKQQPKDNADTAMSKVNVPAGATVSPKTSAKKNSPPEKDVPVADSKSTESPLITNATRGKKRKLATKGLNLPSALPEPSEAASNTSSKELESSTPNKKDIDAKRDTALNAPEAVLATPTNKSKADKESDVAPVKKAKTSKKSLAGKKPTAQAKLKATSKSKKF